jgi:hypothetical protein
VTDTNAAGAATKAKKAAVADRQWIDLTGAEVSDETTATGFRYKDLATGKSFVWQSGGAAGTAITMLAIFGGLTKAGNIRNTLVNAPGADPNEDVVQAINDWFDGVDLGKWGEERVGGPGSRFNREILARAIAEASGHAIGSDFYNARLKRLNENDKVQDPDKKPGTLILYGTFAMRNKIVKDLYNSLLPVNTTAPDLAAL